MPMHIADVDLHFRIKFSQSFRKSNLVSLPPTPDHSFLDNPSESGLTVPSHLIRLQIWEDTSSKI